LRRNTRGGSPAAAQTWPTKPIRIIVPYPPGGTSDILARTLGQKLSEVLGQTIVVDNKPGANGNVGADLVAKAAPDGYTFLLADIGAIAISPSVYPTLAVRSGQGFLAGDDGRVFATHPRRESGRAGAVGRRARRARESEAGQAQLRGIVDRQRTAPRGHRIRQSRRHQLAYIPYKGGAQAITDVVGAQADVLFNGMLATYPHVKGGKLRILAVSSAKRVSSIPDVPTVAESGYPGFETGSWQGISRAARNAARHRREDGHRSDEDPA
jgi:tripartite-type tricarboxylate transporter receptor subunit TctC